MSFRVKNYRLKLLRALRETKIGKNPNKLLKLYLLTTHYNIKGVKRPSSS